MSGGSFKYPSEEEQKSSYRTSQQFSLVYIHYSQASKFQQSVLEELPIMSGFIILVARYLDPWLHGF